MSLLACIGLFAAVVATWIAVSGPGEAALVSAGTVAARGEEQIAAVLVIAFLGTFAGSLAAYWLGRAGGRQLFIAGSVVSGLMWTLTIGHGAFFVGPSLISLYDDAGKWATVAALVAAASVGLFFFVRRARA